jgi:hypothetical protein
MLDGLKRISTALSLVAAFAAVAHAQSPVPSYNQSVADAVATALRSSPTLSPFRIEIETRDGLAALSGNVSSMALKVEALNRARMVPGIKGVVDHLNVVGESSVVPVQYQTAMGHGAPAGGDIIYPGGGMPGAMGPGAMGAGAMGPMAGPIDGPLPEGPAGTGGASMIPTARNPNYAWPSYAPYPKFSAVGYPTAYPWQAWPNIAAPYPYPEVPLDWRAVTLRWDDGIWWLDFKKNYTRPFFTPYPFGIFAY